MGAICQDLCYALRGIVRAPFLSFAVLLALVGGVGLNAAVFTQIALLTLLLAVSGVYGTVAFSMSQRTREIGNRTVLGATKGRILRSVLVSGIQQIAIGLAAGLLFALPTAPAFRLLARNPSVFDWSTYSFAGLVLAAAALCAYYIPARRAMRADPIVALRCK